MSDPNDTPRANAMHSRASVSFNELVDTIEEVELELAAERRKHTPPTEELPMTEVERLSVKWLGAHPHATMNVALAGAALRDALHPVAPQSPPLPFSKHPRCKDVCQNPSKGDTACSKFCDMLPGS